MSSIDRICKKGLPILGTYCYAENEIFQVFRLNFAGGEKPEKLLAIAISAILQSLAKPLKEVQTDFFACLIVLMFLFAAAPRFLFSNLACLASARLNRRGFGLARGFLVSGWRSLLDNRLSSEKTINLLCFDL